MNYQKAAGRFGEIDDESRIERPSIPCPHNNYQNYMHPPCCVNVTTTMFSMDENPSMLTLDSYIVPIEEDNAIHESTADIILPTFPLHRVRIRDACLINDREKEAMTTDLKSQTLDSSLTKMMNLYCNLETSAEDVIMTHQYKTTKKIVGDIATTKYPQSRNDLLLQTKRPADIFFQPPPIDVPDDIMSDKELHVENNFKRTSVGEVVDSAGYKTTSPEPEDSVSAIATATSSKMPFKDISKGDNIPRRDVQALMPRHLQGNAVGNFTDLQAPSSPSIQRKLKGDESELSFQLGFKKQSTMGPPGIADFSSFAMDSGVYSFDESVSEDFSIPEPSANPSMSSDYDDSTLKSLSVRCDKIFSEDPKSLSWKMSTYPELSVAIPGFQRKTNISTLSACEESEQSSNTPHRTLEMAIASKPKERNTDKKVKLPKKGQGRLLKKVFGDYNVIPGYR